MMGYLFKLVFFALLSVNLLLSLPSQANEETYRQLELFGDVFERVRTHYVEPTNDQKLIDSAINGMLRSLDPHSSYLNEDSYREMKVQTRGEFGGLGIEVTLEQGYVRVVSPIDGTPAARAGLETGDLITHLDDKSILGLNLSDAVKKMRGRVGSKIKLTIVREEKDPFEVTIKQIREYMNENNWR